ncbi:type IV pilus biogenesis protein PilM [Pseudoxanthomonas sp. LjRoot168]|uniref:type IV pilus biogenesis protein PilM n=1 Tax=unclassified Pseudoxanthomonas TaxID=2645906 RepID=UPI003ECFB868
MNGNILIVLLLTILFGAGTTTYVVTERKAHHDEILFLSDHVKTYANYVSTAARNNRSLVGSLTREQANVPAFLELDPSIGNYVDRGVAYVFFTPSSLADGNEIARKCGDSILCGVADGSRRIVQPGSGDASQTAPAAVPVGAFVMKLESGDPNCVVPDRESTVESTTETDTQNCPAGQVGQLSLSRTRERNALASCPDPNGPLQWSYTGWSVSDWNVDSGSCTTCPSPSTETNTQWVGVEEGCPAGQFGALFYEAEETQTRTTAFSCPAGTTTMPSPTTTGWSAWAKTGTRRNEAGNCTTCPPPGVDTQREWVKVTGSCPIGQTGTISYEKEMIATRPVSFTCSGGSAMPEATYGPSGPWAESGAMRNNESTCAPCNGPPAMEYEYRWVASSQTCSAGQYGQRTWERQQVRSRSLGYNTCPAAAAAQVKSSAGAKAMASATSSEGRPTGGNGQPRPVEDWGDWTDTGATRNQAGACTACQATQTSQNFQWVNASQSCPAGQTGSWTWQAQQVQSRTTSQNCPAGTLTAPPVNDTGWSGWSNTGARQSESNTCTSAPQHCTAGNTMRGVAWRTMWTNNGFSSSSDTTPWSGGMSASQISAFQYALDHQTYTSYNNYDPQYGGQINQNQSYGYSTGYGDPNACQTASDIGRVMISQSFNMDCVMGQGSHACDYYFEQAYEAFSSCEAICSPTGQPYYDPNAIRTLHDATCTAASPKGSAARDSAIGAFCAGNPARYGDVNWCHVNNYRSYVHVTCS